MVPPRTGPAGRRPAGPQPGNPAADRQEGAAADTIRDAEAALAHQNSATAQVDLQVVSAVLNAHERSTEGREALDRLQHDIEAAVTTRSDLDTPAGARDFQRFLIGKLRDIRAVVASASLDDTSNSALMAAWTSLYNSSKPEMGDADRRQSTGAPAGSATGSAGQSQPATEAGLDPYFDSLPADDPGFLSEDMPAQSPSSPTPMTPDVPGVPSFGGGQMPGGAAMPGLAMPGGFPLPGPLQGGDDQRSPKDLDDALSESDDPEDERSSDQGRRRAGGPSRRRIRGGPAAGVRPDDCHAARPAKRSPLPILSSPQPLRRRRAVRQSPMRSARKGLPFRSGDCGQRPGRPVTARTRGYRHLHRSSRACPRSKQGPAQRSDPAHFHRERAQLPRLGAPSCSGHSGRTG